MARLSNASPNTTLDVARELNKLVEGSEGDARKDEVVAAGALAPLVALLDRSSPRAAELAAQALGWLAKGSDKRSDDIVAAGALAPLVALLGKIESGQAWMAALQAFRALRELARGSNQRKRAINDLGAESALRPLLREEIIWKEASTHTQRAGARCACVFPLRDCLTSGPVSSRQQCRHTVYASQFSHHFNPIVAISGAYYKHF